MGERREFILEPDVTDSDLGITDLAYLKFYAPTWKQFHEIFIVIDQRKSYINQDILKYVVRNNGEMGDR